MPENTTTTEPTIQPPDRRWGLLPLLSGNDWLTRANTRNASSLIALDWNDHYAVLGWWPVSGSSSQAARSEHPRIETHTIPDGLMVNGQWQDAATWIACIEAWVAATTIGQPKVVIALPVQDLTHHWLEAPGNLATERTAVLMDLMDQALADQDLAEQGHLSLIDQVFDVLPESALWASRSSELDEPSTSKTNRRWCLLAALKDKISAHEALFASSSLTLARIDSRPRALMACWQDHVESHGSHCLLDDHLETTGWLIAGEAGVIEMGHVSHERLSMAERVDHLTQRLATSQASHGLECLWLSNGQDDPSVKVANQVADTLGLKMAFIPPINPHQASASQQAVAQGLLADTFEQTRSHAL